MAGSRGRGPTLAKDMNRKLIYGALKQRRSSTRAELASLLSLNKNTVNTIVDELAEAGYIRMTGLRETGGAGRKAVGIEFEAANRKAFGFQLLPHALAGVVTDLYATPLETVELPLDSMTPESVADRLTAFIEEKQTAEGESTFVGVCLGIPALLDAEGERVVQSTHLGWKDVPFRSMLAEKLQQRVLLDHSVKLASQGELWYGAGQGAGHFAYCSFGAGVGCGLVLGGEIVRGESGYAGELGHTVVEPGGPQCGCGNIGCLEAVVGLPAIYARLSRQTGLAPEQMSGGWLAAEVRSGNVAALAEMDRIGRAIGLALAGLVNLLNPKLIICDGPLMQACSDALFPIIRERMRENALYPASVQVELVRSSLPLASAVGAAASVIRAWENQADPLGPIPF